MFFKLKKIVKNGKVLKNEPLKNHTSFRIGGKAKFVVMPSSFEELINLLMYLNQKNVKYYVLGNGTNVLASDNGFKGVVIKLTLLNQIRLYKTYLQVFCGASLSAVCLFLRQHDLGGFEDAFGIPGTIGGAVKMNASAYNFETGKLVLGVLAIVDGNVKYLNHEECGFGYRKSAFKNAIILSVDFAITKGCNAKRMEEVIALRKIFQPLNLPSAGSVFKRADGVPVSKMLDELGFKGKSVGGAKVSEKHAGFIVNFNNATEHDVKKLIAEIKAEVYKTKGIILEEEIKFF